MKVIFFIFLGGGLGSVMRYLINRWITGLVNPIFPLGTFLVNMSGCFLIGFLVFYSERFGANSLNWRWFLVTGFCGGYTTYSSYSFENVQLMTTQHVGIMLVYILGSVAIGLAATYAGIILSRNI